jgi:murein DD-endopeptidase MepM/ murein hydrolase activator NlpD
MGLVTLLIPRSVTAEWSLWTAEAAGGEEILVHDPGLVLLEAAVNPDPNPTKGGQLLVVSEGSALMASAGVATEVALEKLDEAEEPTEKAEKKADVKAPKPAVKKAAAAKAPAKKAAAKPTVKKLSGAGYFGNPLPGGRKSQGVHGNNAVDISAPAGTPIYAAAAGRITVAKCDGGYNSGWGNYIKIAHGNGSQTLYAHMSRCAAIGGSVAKGQLIGYVGNTGKSTGNHLHFETYGASNPLR